MAGIGAMGGSGGGKGGGGGYSNQTAATATGKQDGMFNDSGYVVNYGAGTAGATTGTPGGGMPGWLLPALGVGVAVWLATHKH